MAKMLVNVYYDAPADPSHNLRLFVSYRTDTGKTGEGIPLNVTAAQLAATTPASVLSFIKARAVSRYFELEAQTITDADVLVFGAPQ